MRIEAQGRIAVNAVDRFGHFAAQLLFAELDAEIFSHAGGEFRINPRQQVHDPLADVRAHYLAQFKAEAVDDMQLLRFSLAQPEKPRVGKVFAEGLAALPHFLPFDLLGIGCKNRLRQRIPALHAASCR